MSYDAVTTPNKRSREEGIKTLVVIREMGKGGRCVRKDRFIYSTPLLPAALPFPNRSGKKEKEN